MLTLILMYLLLGAAAGLMAGLFGVGGGLLIVPVLVLSFKLQGMPNEVLTHAAIATSLATIVVTSISSTWAHNRRNSVRWDIFKIVMPGILVGAFLGVKTAVELSGTWLQIGLGTFTIILAARMFFNWKIVEGERTLPAYVHLTAGSFIGWFSSLFGIGGGALTVPYLRWGRLSMQHAVATSAACGIPISLMGTITNIMEGWFRPDMPSWSIGYIYLPALLGIVLTSVWFARLGTKLAHKLSTEVLQQTFAGFLFFIGIWLWVSNLL